MVQKWCYKSKMSKLAAKLALVSLFSAGIAIHAQQTPATFKQSFLYQLGETEKKLVSLAEAVPEDKFSWRPAEGVRSMGEVFMHEAGANVFFLTSLGVKPPAGFDPKGEKTATEKSKIIQAMKDSFTHVRTAVTAMSDEDMQKGGKLMGKPATYESILFFMCDHMHEHLRPVDRVCPNERHRSAIIQGQGKLVAAALICIALMAQSERPRLRDLGVNPGVLSPGPLNAITDVAGVAVGQTTLIREHDVRTGVTAILPHTRNLFREKVRGAVFVGNAFGKLAGSTQVEELGEIETPILLTSTLNVRVWPMRYSTTCWPYREMRTFNPSIRSLVRLTTDT